MGKIITMGEIMLRLSTPGQSRFVQTDTFDINYGGGEANVAVSCAHYGHEAYFVSKLPKHEIGQAAVNALRRYGVHTDFIARGGQRVGIFTTVQFHLLQKPVRPISISTPSWKGPIGFIGAASHRLFQTPVPNACARHVLQPKSTV